LDGKFPKKFAARRTFRPKKRAATLSDRGSGKIQSAAWRLPALVVVATATLAALATATTSAATTAFTAAATAVATTAAAATISAATATAVATTTAAAATISAATAATAVATRTGLTRLSWVHAQSTTTHILAVKRFCGFLHPVLISQSHEAETTRASSFTIGNEFHFLHCTKGREEFGYFFFGSSKGQIAHVDVHWSYQTKRRYFLKHSPGKWRQDPIKRSR
jgi:hypothetical protein